MSKTIEPNNQISYSRDRNSSLSKGRNNSNMIDSLMDTSSNNNSSIIKNNKNTTLKNNPIPKIFLNKHFTNFPSNENRYQSNKYLHTYNYPKIFQNQKRNNQIKIFDRPIYNYDLSQNTMPKMLNRLKRSRIKKYNNKSLCLISLENNQDNNNSLIYDYTEKKISFRNNNYNDNSLNENERYKRRRFDYIVNSFKNRKYDFFPRLLDSKRSIMVNNKNDKYKDKSILFTKIKELNFENEVKNTNRKNFITIDKYIDRNPKEKGKFLEKKITYKILDNIRFRIKSPIDRSKLLKFTKNFNSLFSINKFY